MFDELYMYKDDIEKELVFRLYGINWTIKSFSKQTL